jgi:hypothetical protein
MNVCVERGGGGGFFYSNAGAQLTSKDATKVAI